MDLVFGNGRFTADFECADISNRKAFELSLSHIGKKKQIVYIPHGIA